MPGYVRPLLAFLIVLDFALAAIGLFVPQVWWQVMHGVEGQDDPFGMLTRLGAVWLAFLILQVVALVRHRQEPAWLAVIAGVRWTEMLADGVYWAQAPSLTWFGHAGLLASPPANILFGWLLWRAYQTTKQR